MTYYLSIKILTINMKYFFLVCSILAASFSFGQEHSLVKIWETDTLLKTPESVLAYKHCGFLFVSNIDGGAAAKDGKGSVGKVSLDGKIIKTDWVSGLNAPKGMGILGNLLYVADLTEVVVIDIKKEKVIQHIPVDSSTFLNDIAVDKKGIVYVSDTRTGKVHRIENGKATTYLSKLKAPNGLLCVDDILYVLDKGSLLKVTSNKQITSLADGMDASTDGIEMVTTDEFIVSCWAGIIYYVKADGNKQILFDNRATKINSADIGYNAKEKIVYVPTFYGNKVVAYQLK
ncbi:SMP-30/gluconolactonase/LRE family protein [Parasediminibacterium sp. JCM 36343]|uniref:SMP-30/gluconolactonase/LRE family protein n=1 Tax=Parasediminibacterium sp. JCM 36343 TaxID=3374279 RepID=UPI00397C0848